MLHLIEELLQSMREAWEVVRHSEEDAEVAGRGLFRVLMIAVFVIPFVQTIFAATVEGRGIKVFLAFLPIAALFLTFYLFLRRPILTGVALVNPTPLRSLDPARDALLKFFTYLFTAFGIETAYGAGMALIPGHNDGSLTMLLYVLIMTLVLFVAMPKSKTKKWLVVGTLLTIAIIVVVLIYPSTERGFLQSGSHESTAQNTATATAQKMANIPDCADQEDVFMQDGETVKRLHLAPCRSGWIHTPPGREWFAETDPHNLALTLCYWDGGCIYTSANEYKNLGVKRGIFQAIGSGEGELVVTVGYPKGTKPKTKKEEGVKTASGSEAETEESEIIGTVKEILPLEGSVILATTNGDVPLQPRNSLLYDDKGFHSWYALRQGYRVKVVFVGQVDNGEVRYIKYLGGE